MYRGSMYRNNVQGGLMYRLMYRVNEHAGLLWSIVPEENAIPVHSPVD